MPSWRAAVFSGRWKYWESLSSVISTVGTERWRAEGLPDTELMVLNNSEEAGAPPGPLPHAGRHSSGALSSKVASCAAVLDLTPIASWLNALYVNVEGTSTAGTWSSLVMVRLAGQQDVRGAAEPETSGRIMKDLSCACR